MIGRLKDLNSSIKRRVIFNRDEIADSLNEGITSQRENIVEEPVNNDVDIRSTSQNYDREEADRQLVRQKLTEMQNQSKRISFGQAFKNARAAGKKTFWWRGKEYNTKTKEEAEAEKKSKSNKRLISNTSRNSFNNKNTIINNKKSNTSNNTTKSNKTFNITNKSNKTNISNKTVKQNNIRNRNIANTQKNNISNFSSKELEAIRRAEENKKRYNLVQKTPSKYRQNNGGYSAVGGAMRIK